MTETKNPSEAAADVLPVIELQAYRLSAARLTAELRGHMIAELQEASTAVAALIARNAELEAKTAVQMGVGDGASQLYVYGDYESIKAAQALVLRLEALAAENKALRDLVEAGRRAIGEHIVPEYCYSTGPLTGDPVLDLVECPACTFIAMDDARTSSAAGGGNG